MSFAQIISQIENQKFSPVYFLMGDEDFFIDQIANKLEEKVLTEEEKSFNLHLLYGKDIDAQQVISTAKRYPMMTERQLVIVREAQHFGKELEKLESYFESPTPSTVLVFLYKGKTLDKRKKVTKLIQKNGLVYESKKLYDNQLPQFIQSLAEKYKLKIDHKMSFLLAERLGNDLSKISNELSKLSLLVDPNSVVTEDILEEYIGISRKYNPFELTKSISNRDYSRSLEIIKYFEENPKSGPLVLVIGNLYTFFSNLLKYHLTPDKSQQNIAKTLKIHPFFVSEYQTASRNYNLKQVVKTIKNLLDADLQSKGITSSNVPESEIMEMFLVKTMR